MKAESIAAISKGVPGAVDLIDPIWPDEVVRVDERDPLTTDIEEGLYPTDDPDDPDPLANIPDDRLPDIETSPDDWGRPLDEENVYGPVSRIAERLRERFGDGWPGAPGGTTMGPGHKTPIRPPLSTDIYAFYLPWHRFRPNLWGIYLLVEGIEALGNEIYGRRSRVLSRAEARRAAKMFLYHHEAYHNAVETFAGRVEVSHRLPCYLTGVQSCAKTFLAKSKLHEEGLANAYAHEFVRRSLLADVKGMSPARRRVKRNAAADALRIISRGLSPPYASAELILNDTVEFDDAEFELQESIHTLSSLGVPAAVPEIWLGAGRSMMPSLARNKRFSYVVSSTHPIRVAATVPHFKRRDVIRRLHVAFGVTEEGGGKHPKIVVETATGKKKRIPVPGHTELDRQTTRSILREINATVALSRFMSATDSELRQLGAKK